MKSSFRTMDGNEAVARVAFQLNEVIALYPITPATPMGEWADDWAAGKKTNLWGAIPALMEMQSEAGAAGALHGALQAGSLATTFTSSQGLLLMIPEMYKIAGELTATVIHVAARAIATQALSIFGDHSDVMAARNTGFALLCSASVQEAQDFALIAHAATLEARIPFLHFFDGFRTSHEVAKIHPLDDETLRDMINDQRIKEHRARALSPDHPFIRGTSQNPDVYFQSRETVNPYYLACPTIVQQTMDQFERLAGRSYRLFEYTGAPDAERVIVIMGSGAEAVQETVEYLTQRGEKVGVLKVHLFRPFSTQHFLAALPPTTQILGVMDRTKEPGSIGEPLYLECLAGLNIDRISDERHFLIPPRAIGGRYGLSSKEFTPSMVRRIFDELARERPKKHFTIGIHDDVTHTSLDYDPAFSTEDPSAVRALFYGLGSDGTVGANKNSVKIIGEKTDLYAQGYFVYDSKKSGSVTISHLRFGPRPIRASYLISRANFVACHLFSFLERIDILEAAEQGATFLLNSPHGAETVWARLPSNVREHLLKKKIRFYVIDAHRVAREIGLQGRINTIMQTCFFALVNLLPKEKATQAIKEAIQKTFGKRGEAILQKNYAAVDAALQNLHEVPLPKGEVALAQGEGPQPFELPLANGNKFVQRVIAPLMAGKGDTLPVSALPMDGAWPSGTTRFEKRNMATHLPVWDTDLCIQCGKCALVCPHAVIRAKVYAPSLLSGAPGAFKSAKARAPFTDRNYTLQVAPEDCTGCALCVEICPVKDKKTPERKALNMAPIMPLLEPERKNWDFFLGLPEVSRESLPLNQVKNAQFLQPLFEFSGACAGCGETPYLKLLSQLFGDRALIANATGCSSIYGGNLPTTPWTFNAEGRGPAWSNSLFEDNAEFGLGMRLSLDHQEEQARALLRNLAKDVGENLAIPLLEADQSNEEGIRKQRERVAALKEKLRLMKNHRSGDLLAFSDALVRKSVWIVGGDGWAYDIGYGGLDHVLSSGRKVNVLVLDTEVYSNTGGQNSKSTPRGAVARFAAGGKRSRKKDLGLLAMMQGNVYVAQVALGGNDTHVLKAFLEAEAYVGPSLIIAYGHCIAHGINMTHGLSQQKAAVDSGHWPLFRFNPDLVKKGLNPLQLDSKPPTLPLEEYFRNETRFTLLSRSDPEAAKNLLRESQEDILRQRKFYEYLAAMKI